MLRLSRDNRFIFLSNLLLGAGNGLYAHIWTLYIERLGANPVRIGSMLSLGNIVMTLAFIPGGFLADRYSRRKLLIGGGAVWTLGCLLVALAEDWRQLIPGIILISLSAFAWPASDAYVAAASAGEDLGYTYSLIFSSFSLGMLLTPPLGGWMAVRMGMRTIFYAVSALVGFSTLVLLFLSEQPISSSLTETAGYLKMLRDRRSFLYMMLFSSASFILSLGGSFIPNYLQDVTKLRISWISGLGTFNSLGAFALAVCLGRFSIRMEKRWGIALAEALTWIGYILFLRSRALPLLALSFFLRGGWAAIGSLSTAYMADIFPKGALGRGLGLLGIFRNTAWTLAPYLAGWLYNARPDLPFLITLALLPLMALATILAVRQPISRALP